MKRYTIPILLIFVLIISLTTVACRREMTEEEIKAMNESLWWQLPLEVIFEHEDKAIYAGDFVFDYFQGEYLGSVRQAMQHVRQSGKSVVAFVHSREEAEAGDEDTFYFWPTERTVRRISAMNYVIQKHNIDISEFSLSYPITMEDALEQWRSVRNLYWHDLGRLHGEIRSRQQYLARAQEEANDNIEQEDD